MDFIWSPAGNTSLFQGLRLSPLQEPFHLRPIERVQPLAAASSDQGFGNVKNTDIRLSISMRAVLATICHLTESGLWPKPVWFEMSARIIIRQFVRPNSGCHRVSSGD
jgi:hypothetical protein